MRDGNDLNCGACLSIDNKVRKAAKSILTGAMDVGGPLARAIKDLLDGMVQRGHESSRRRVAPGCVPFAGCARLCDGLGMELKRWADHCLPLRSSDEPRSK